MTPRERVLAALNRREPDRVPRTLGFTPPMFEKFRQHTGSDSPADYFDFEVRHAGLQPTRLETDFSPYLGELPPNAWVNEWGIGQACVSVMAGADNLQWPAPTGDKDPGCSDGIIVAEPGLGELSDNGGATETVPLLDGSPAIDAGEGCTETDQRGEARVGPCDLGAYEVQ